MAILTIDSESKELTVAVRNGNKMETYQCKISACENPACLCGTTQLHLTPIRSDDELSPREVHIDVLKKSLGYADKNKVPAQDLEFAELLLGRLEESDYQILQSGYIAYKRKITEEIDPRLIEADFAYADIEEEGTMLGYNEILPYGNQLHVKIDSRECIIMDRYCVRPKCSCTDTILQIMPIDSMREGKDESWMVFLDYVKKHWKTTEYTSLPVNIKSIRMSLETQIPDLYKQLPVRHGKLKAVYQHCRKKYLAAQEHQLAKAEGKQMDEQGYAEAAVQQAPVREGPKIGRNAPCPCGSGKKYKKCCLGTADK